jgi:predicted RNase H-like HicB family nuclease
MKELTEKDFYNFPIIIEKDEDGYFVASCPVLQGCYTQARTEKEVFKRIQEVIDLHLKARDIKIGFIPQRKIKTFSTISG